MKDWTKETERELDDLTHRLPSTSPLYLARALMGLIKALLAIAQEIYYLRMAMERKR